MNMLLSIVLVSIFYSPFFASAMPASFLFLAFASSLMMTAPANFGVGRKFGAVGPGLLEKYGICKALEIKTQNLLSKQNIFG